jgi:phosphatidylglycerophosphate synthase
MLDTVLRRTSEPFLAPLAGRLSGFGMRADAMTLAAFVSGIATAVDIGYRNYLIAVGFLVLRAIIDSLDGPVARREEGGRFGAHLDSVLDIGFSSAIPFAFALAEPNRALAAMFLLLGLTVRAGASSTEGDDSGPLGQLGALVGKTELLIAFALACIFPNWFSMIAYCVGVLCFLAAGGRVAAAASQA